MEGIKDGFRIQFDGSRAVVRPAMYMNMPSTQEHPEVVDSYLAEECGEGRVIGPLRPEWVPGVHCSRFGVIPKATSGKWRLITDLSFPHGEAVNDGIGEAVSLLTYVGVQDAVRAIVQLGMGTVLAKVDTKTAYCNVPVHPEDKWLLGMRWHGSVFTDSALPFGLRSAPKKFTALADAVEWIARQEGVELIMHYLDDFFSYWGARYRRQQASS